MMNRRFTFSIKLFTYISILSCFLLHTLGIQAQGLFFKGNEYIIDQRTSYNVLRKISPTFKDSLVISFDLSAEHKPNTGYIYRIKTQEPSLTFNLSYDSQGADVAYKLNEEGKSTLIAIHLSKENTRSGAWLPTELKFDLSKQLIFFKIGNKRDSCSIKLPKTLKPEIHFGRSDYFIDLPTFSIRNLYLRDKTEKFFFQFREHEGNSVHDQNGTEIGYIENPTWLINKAYYWNHIASFKSIPTAGFNFDSITNKIYYYNKDSIKVYDVINKWSESHAYKNDFPIDLRLGYSLLNSKEQSLYSYEVVPRSEGGTTVAKYDLHGKLWSSISTDRLPLQLHHHGRFFDEKNNRFIIFGGFGDMYYNNEFNCYDLTTNRWTKLAFTGDTIFPRYFLSMGYSKTNNSLYIFGGMGNESGEYNVGRRYYYDLYQVDLSKMHITKLWEIPWSKDHVVPVKSMLMTDDHFMTLCYPEHFSNTHLKLYRFSIEDGSYEILGDSIPIRSEKITTNADLFYSSEMGELYGVVQEFEDDDIASSLNIYSLATPAVSHNELFLANNSTPDLTFLYWIISIIAAIGLYVIGKKTLRKKIENNKILSPAYNSSKKKKNTDTENSIVKKKNSIFTFGDFTVYDRKGRDISYMFSTRLKQTFLVILEHSLNDGISTQQLTNLLWSDRDDEKAKNIRGVTINGLRKLLEELDGINLVYEKSHYKIVLDESAFCDYTKCIELVSLDKNDTNISLFTSIISRGKFLNNDEDPIYDSLKSSLERLVEPILNKLIEEDYKNKKFESVISLSEAMFNIDPISDFAISYLSNAMEKLDMASESRKRFFKFIVEYKKMIGEEYPKDYSDIIKNGDS